MNFNKMTQKIPYNLFLVAIIFPFVGLVTHKSILEEYL